MGWKHKTIKNTEALLEATREVGLEVNTDKSHQHAGKIIIY
jgi:hypothetical protein